MPVGAGANRVIGRGTRVIERQNTEALASCRALAAVAPRVAGSPTDSPNRNFSDTEQYRTRAPRVSGRARLFTPTRR